MSNIKEVLETVFPVIKGEINEDGSELSFSVGVEDPKLLEEYYDKLYALEHYINVSGYGLMMQEDDDYFGGTLTLRK
jgi:hypothetical protein